tara:strand:+ start:920 stop:1699 length:780 start_codon:yes stop_codon:yes gene_type:complete
VLLGKLVIGSSVESVLYAFLSDSYFLPTLKFGPIFYDTLSVNLLGNRKADRSWSRFQTILSLSGKLLNYKKINNIRISNDNLSISSSEGFHKYKFENCTIFDTTGIQMDNSLTKQVPTLYRVYDDFELSNLGGKHKFLEPFTSSDGFVEKINYYTSSRVDGADYVTDCVAESILTKEQTRDFEYSDSMVRFAVIRHLAHIGVHGSFMNFYKNGSRKFRKPKVTHRKRVVLEMDQNIYEDTQRVKIKNLSIEEVLSEFST